MVKNFIVTYEYFFDYRLSAIRKNQNLYLQWITKNKNGKNKFEYKTWLSAILEKKENLYLQWIT